ncbi:DUF6414 family protein [Micromonospora marina]|uniref:DUF6414 family protein n=1 Tax=Micromonospora marina TaxID=307120 RepID=UPI003D75FDDC
MIFRRRSRRWAKQRREFVYLDEVSVTSLIASRDGAIKESVKETFTRSTERESKTIAGSSGKSFKFSTEFRTKNAETAAHEVVRKAVIQSTFRDLRTGGDEELLLRTDRKRQRREVKSCSLATQADVLRHRKKLARHGQLVALKDLARGDVLELDVILSADRAYQLVAAASSIVEIVKGREAIFGINKTEYDQVVHSLEVIDSLLVGLVPICGTSRDFAILNISGDEFIVDRRVLDPSGSVMNELRPLEIVGVTNFSSYSRDLRRVLFGQQSYTAYIRVEVAALRDSWQPVKLADVLETMSINVGEFLSLLPEEFTPADASEDDGVALADDLTGALSDFGRRLALDSGGTLDEAVLQETVAQAVPMLADAANLESRRAAFDMVAHAVDPTIDRDVVRLARQLAQNEIAAKAVKGSSQAVIAPEVPSVAATRKLEVEFVAIYW